MGGKNDFGSRMVSLMRNEGAKNNGFEMTQAKVTAVNPVALSYNSTSISDNIVLSGCLQTVTALEDAIDSEPEVSQGFKDALKEIVSGIKLSVGDSVVVQRVENTFYIIGKVNP